MRPPALPGATLLSRAALALYPPSWRARYADEVRALLDDSGGGLPAAASVAWRAVPAWICPPRHLHDGPGRMRSSLATALVAWSMLTGLGLIFAQLTQFQGFTCRVIRRSAGPMPSSTLHWLSRCWSPGSAGCRCGCCAAPGLAQRRPREAVYLLLPLIVPAVYLIALIVTVRLVGGAGGVSPWWFVVVCLAGFAAAATAAAGPGLALRRLSHGGQPCAWPRSRRVWRPRSWRWPPRPSSSPSSACACGRVVSPATTPAPSRRLPGPGRRRRDRHHDERRAGARAALAEPAAGEARPAELLALWPAP